MGFYPSQLPPSMRRFFWRWSYEWMARLWQRADWQLMNYGFEPTDSDPGGRPELRETDEPDRSCIQLYHRVASQRPLSDLRVVEVGSGRGGGAAYVHRYLGPATTVGVDLSEAAVDLASRIHEQPGLSFQAGDAEDLPLDDQSTDIVLNVESSHCYGRMEQFLAEVHRVLAPGGYLLLTDLRLHSRVTDLDATIADSDLELEERVDITEGVVRGLRVDSARREKLIRETAGWWLRGPLGAFAAVEGSSTFRDLDSRHFVYLCYALRRPVESS
ncbi:MAG: class I SAM-dependent methyltransferase [Myxococcota bacterium]|nr:class I SAM-dependent methyltransferase [Myxococcota bacterium]